MFQQHDVHELCRILLDSIEQSYAVAGQEGKAVREIYEGKQCSFVRCDECGYVSKSVDTFMDLSLPVKNSPDIGGTNDTLEAALETYLRPERLVGDNQYWCSRCEKKVNATKGLELDTLSDILTL